MPRVRPQRSAARAAALGNRAGKAVNIGILAFEGCMGSAVVGALEFFRVTNVLASLTNAAPGCVQFKPEIVTRGRRTVSCGPTVRLAGVPPMKQLDMLVVPGIWHESPRDLAAAVGRLGGEVALVREAHDSGAIVAAGCGGTTLAAEAGILDGRTATTAWWLGEYFREHYPNVRLDLPQVLTTDGRVWTAGAASSYRSLCLKAVEHFAGVEIAALASRFMLIDANPTLQAPYALEAIQAPAADPAVAKVQDWIRRNLGRPIGIDEMASIAATSTRTLIRKFRGVLGTTPLSYVQKLRIERAKTLLTTSNLSLQAIIDRAGYEDMSSFRKLFRTHTGLGPRDYRDKFRIRSARRPAAGNPRPARQAF